MSNSAITWQEPIPLENYQEFIPYPIDSLPKIIADAVIAYQQYGQQPLPLIACSALSNISLACQTMANIARDHMLISPVSVYFLVAAASGERKSAADKVFGERIRAWQATTRTNLAPYAEEQKMLHRIWQHQKEGLLKQIRSLALNSESTATEELQLRNLVTNEPKLLLLPELFFEDVTQEALVNQLATGWPSSSLWSDEGGIVLSSHGMQSNVTKFIATLNRLWDGNSFITHRKTSANLTVTNRRLTLSLMLQPAILEKMLTRSDGIMRQSGFLARTLITYPQSAIGERLYKEPATSLPELEAFHQRINECLESSLDLDRHGCHAMPTLQFSPSAKATWVKFFNQTEQNLTKNSKWLIIQDFASKSAENVARISALLHLFSGKDGTIAQQSVEQAVNIVTWHLHETRRILDPEKGSSINSDAQKLLAWLQKRKLETVTPRYILQHGPRPIREKAKLDKTINLLIENNYMQQVKIDRTSNLIINPQSLNHNRSMAT
ncbi:MAG: DUF3987 domain-containing protein [Rickettsiaceae bacterium]|nr:DUF3987 domain-containing protein [Rickettsiaceae bacterium]